MKNLLLTFAIFFVLIFIGCQENSITDPVSTEAINKEQTSDTYLHGFISLEGALNDPYPVWNSHYIISGQIEFEHILVSNNYVSLHMVTDAEFRSLCTACSPSQKDELVATISNDTEDNLILINNYIVLEKSFTIKEREDMILKCRFLVSSDGIELNEMRLEIVSGNSQIELTD